MQTYAIQAGRSGPIKIGRTTDDIMLRLAALQVGNHEEVRLVGMIDGDREAEVHERFAGLRLRGEWFTPSESILRFFSEEGHQPCPRQSKLGHPMAFHRRAWLTPREVAGVLGVRASRVLNWIASARLAAVNINGDNCLKRPRYKVSSAALEVFLLGLEVPKPERASRRIRDDAVVIKYV